MTPLGVRRSSNSLQRLCAINMCIKDAHKLLINLTLHWISCVWTCTLQNKNTMSLSDKNEMELDYQDLNTFICLNFETLLLQVSATIWHLSIGERLRKKKAQLHFWKNNGTSLATVSFSITVNDLTESIIHSHRRLINVRRFTSVQ